MEAEVKKTDNKTKSPNKNTSRARGNTGRTAPKGFTKPREDIVLKLMSTVPEVIGGKWRKDGKVMCDACKKVGNTMMVAHAHEDTYIQEDLMCDCGNRITLRFMGNSKERSQDTKEKEG